MIYPLLDLIEILYDTDYGSIAVHKYDVNQTQHIKNTKRAPDHDEIIFLDQIYKKYKSFYDSNKKNKIIDIGANIGLYSRCWAANNPEVTIDAYEPYPSVWYISKLNSVNLTNITIYPDAIGEHNKEVLLPVYDEKITANYGCTSLHPNTNLARNESISTVVNHMIIKSKSLDALYANDDEYNYIFAKIDTEGTEGIILENARDFLKNKKPILFVEHFPENQWVTEIERRGSYSTQWFLDFFKEMEYNYIGYLGINMIAIPNNLPVPS